MEADPATGNNNDQGKCLGTKLGALHPELYATVAVAVSVSQLCLGQIGNFINLDVRIELAKKAYVEIQHLSQNFELIKDKPGLTMGEVKKLVSDYQVLISTTENHFPKHYRKTVK